MTAEMPKQRITITIRKELLEWIDDKVKDLTYASRTHAIEKAVAELKKQQKTQP